MAIDLTGIVTWLKGWFYEKTEITGYLNNKANQSDLTALQGIVNRVSDTVNNHGHSADLIADTNDQQGGYSNIGVTLPATQMAINTAIDNKIGVLTSFKAIEITNTKPTASASTMNKLYIVNENSKVNVYYTKQNGNSYSLEKMDTDILDEYTVNWTDVQGKPSFGTGTNDFARGNHGHGSITTDGKLGTANNFVVTDANKNITTKSSIGNISLDGKVGNASSLVVTDGNRYIATTSAITGTYVIGEGNYENIGTNIGDSLTLILDKIDTELGKKADASGVITSIVKVPKRDDESGTLRFYCGDEP